MADLTEPDKARHQAAAVEDLVVALRRATSVFVLTGSGISAQSGLPTFRGVGGLWRTHRVEELASPQGFARDPVLVWTWYNERKTAHAKAQPNAGHTALAQLERAFGDFTLATQNVDSLHLRAGSSSVLELHGDLREARCTGCGIRRPLEENGLPTSQIEHACGDAGGPTSSGLANRFPPGCGARRNQRPPAPTSSSWSVRALSSIRPPPLRQAITRAHS